MNKKRRFLQIGVERILPLFINLMLVSFLLGAAMGILLLLQTLFIQSVKFSQTWKGILSGFIFIYLFFEMRKIMRKLNKDLNQFIKRNI